MSVSTFKSKYKTRSVTELEKITANSTYTDEARQAAAELLKEKLPNSVAITNFNTHIDKQVKLQQGKRDTMFRHLNNIQIGDTKIYRSSHKYLSVERKTEVQFDLKLTTERWNCGIVVYNTATRTYRYKFNHEDNLFIPIISVAFSIFTYYLFENYYFVLMSLLILPIFTAVLQLFSFLFLDETIIKPFEEIFTEPA